MSKVAAIGFGLSLGDKSELEILRQDLRGKFPEV